MRLNSLVWRLTFAFVLIALLPIAGLGVVNYITTRQALETAANQALASAATQIAAELDAEIQGVQNIIRADAERAIVSQFLMDYNPDLEAELLSEVLGSLGLGQENQWTIDSYAILDASGINLLDTNNSSIGNDESGQPYFEGAIRTGQPYISPVLFPQRRGSTVAFYFAVPVRANRIEQTIGVLRVRYRLAAIQERVRQGSRLVGNESVAWLLSEHNLILEAGDSNLLFRLAAPPPAPIEQLQANSLLPRQVALLDDPLSPSTALPSFFTASLAGETYQIALASMQSQPWQVAYVQLQAEFLQPVEQQTRTALLIIAGVGLFTATAGVVLSRFFTRPVLALAEIARTVAAGQLTGLVWPRARRDELGQLAQSFQAMTEQLQTLLENLETQVAQRTQELQQTVDELRQTQDALVETETQAALARLVAGVAHEANTPLSIALIASQEIGQQATRTRQAYEAGSLTEAGLLAFFNKLDEVSEPLDTNLRRAASLVKNFKMIVADQVALDRRGFNVVEYIESALSNLGPELRQTPHQVQVAGDKTLHLDSYPGALAQICINLVQNSLYHAFADSQAGQMRFTVMSEDAQAIITYTDNGQGMSPEVQAKIFQPFFTTRRNQGGTGLGMFITYNLVRRMQGDIQVESQPGEGVKFTITVPIEITEEPYDINH